MGFGALDINRGGLMGNMDVCVGSPRKGEPALLQKGSFVGHFGTYFLPSSNDSRLLFATIQHP